MRRLIHRMSGLWRVGRASDDSPPVCRPAAPHFGARSKDFARTRARDLGHLQTIIGRFLAQPCGFARITLLGDLTNPASRWRDEGVHVRAKPGASAGVLVYPSRSFTPLRCVRRRAVCPHARAEPISAAYFRRISRRIAGLISGPFGSQIRRRVTGVRKYPPFGGYRRVA